MQVVMYVIHVSGVTHVMRAIPVMGHVKRVKIVILVKCVMVVEFNYGMFIV